MSTEWYYSQGGQQLGPVTSQQLKDFAAAGQLTPSDLVWKDGMPEWTPASRVKGLFAASPASPLPQTGYAPQPGYANNPQTAYSAPQAAYAAPQPAYAAPQQGYAAPQSGGYDQGGQIGYYSATSDIGARTARILRGLPSVTGSRGDWPLSDHHLAQLSHAESYRKGIRAFYLMCRILMMLSIILACIILITLLGTPRMMRRGDSEPLVTLLVSVGLAVLYPFCGAAAMKCRAWGAITVLVLQLISLCFLLYMLVQMMNEPFIPTQAYMVPGIGMLLTGLFIFIAIRSLVATPKFLNSPVWCVEAMINAKL